jgi:hypothetical protein
MKRFISLRTVAGACVFGVAGLVVALTVASPADAAGPKGGPRPSGPRPSSAKSGPGSFKPTTRVSVKNYHLSYGTRFSHGYYYHGRHHYHWGHRYYHHRYRCWCYWCPSTRGYYYYYRRHNRFYPMSYQPEGGERSMADGFTDTDVPVAETSVQDPDAAIPVTNGPVAGADAGLSKRPERAAERERE